MAYASLSELRSWLGIDDVIDDASIAAALGVGERRAEDIAGRKFTASTVVSARTMRPLDPWLLRLEAGWDIQSTTGLIVRTDDNDDGVHETTWTLGTDFELVDGGYSGDGSWPATALTAVGSKTWPTATLRRSVQITALWGWAAVPPAVKQATLILAAEAWKLKDAPFGVAAFSDFGPMRVRDNPVVGQLLARYRHPSTSAVIA